MQVIYEQHKQWSASVLWISSSLSFFLCLPISPWILISFSIRPHQSNLICFIVAGSLVCSLSLIGLRVHCTRNPVIKLAMTFQTFDYFIYFELIFLDYYFFPFNVSVASTSNGSRDHCKPIGDSLQINNCLFYSLSRFSSIVKLNCQFELIIEIHVVDFNGQLSV